MIQLNKISRLKKELNMKKLILVLGLLLTIVCSVFAIDEKTANTAVENFLSDKNATLLKLKVTEYGITANGIAGDVYARAYARADEISGFAIEDGFISIVYSQNLSKSKLDSYFSLSKVSEISYNPKTGVLTISASK